MTQKTRILAAIMAVLVLAGSLALAVSADGEMRSELIEKELPGGGKDNRNSAVYYGYTLNPDFQYYSGPLNTENYTDCVIRFLFDGGNYCEFAHVEDSDPIKKNNRALSETFDWYSACIVVFGYSLLSDNSYYYESPSEFISSENWLISFSLPGVFLLSSENYATYRLSDYCRFAVLNYDGTDVYCGCHESDFLTEVTLADLPSLYCGGSSAPTTLTDWFFDTAFPVFGSVDADSIDLGILGNYQPIQLYKFLFSLSLVVVAIVLLVWLPMYGLFRLLGIKRKKR